MDIFTVYLCLAAYRVNFAKEKVRWRMFFMNILFLF